MGAVTESGTIVLDHYKRLAAYNAWANARLYDAATALTDFERKRAIKGYFGSLHGTLNHLMGADRIWLYRLTGEGPLPSTLDAIHYETFEELRDAREAEDKRIQDFVATLTAADLEAELAYVNTRGEEKSLARQIILAHLFNHQTHHRGQATQMLRQLGVAEPPTLDLLYFALPTA
jgi:uncharacterized damage-inducible protein DinB